MCVFLPKSNIVPYKVCYFLDRKDPEFDAKAAASLCPYKS